MRSSKALRQSLPEERCGVRELEEPRELEGRDMQIPEELEEPREQQEQVRRQFQCNYTTRYTPPAMLRALVL